MRDAIRRRLYWLDLYLHARRLGHSHGVARSWASWCASPWPPAPTTGPVADIPLNHAGDDEAEGA